MKYLVFIYPDHYPNGGMGDCIGVFDQLPTADEMLACIKTGGIQYHWETGDWEASAIEDGFGDAWEYVNCAHDPDDVPHQWVRREILSVCPFGAGRRLEKARDAA